jgi:hypothetical protein
LLKAKFGKAEALFITLLSKLVCLALASLVGGQRANGLLNIFIKN